MYCLLNKFCSEYEFFISSIKQSIVKNKSRKGAFVNIGVPPDVILIRWGSWLRAAFYYAEKFPVVQKIVTSFKDDGKIVQCAKNSINQPQIKQLVTIGHF